MNLVFTHNPADALARILGEAGSPHTVILADSNTLTACAEPLRLACPPLADAPIITIEAGDSHKDIDSLSHIWERMQAFGMTRRSLLVNVGGGVVTDIGGFAAATFKRGVRFVNIPTTLLAAVDASAGGKTGINFGGLKNEIGVFCDADAVVISTGWLATLPSRELRSGYAEMLKHGLLSSASDYRSLLDFDIATADLAALLPLVERSVMVKKRIVDEDPREQGLRRALNLGHTAGHAFESLALKRGKPVPHGYAVAWGLVVDAVLSHLRLGLPAETVRELADYVRRVYGVPLIGCKDYPALLELMSHDKKNATPDAINFTLLEAPGRVSIDSVVGKEEIEAALDIFRDLMGV